MSDDDGFGTTKTVARKETERCFMQINQLLETTGIIKPPLESRVTIFGPIIMSQNKPNLNYQDLTESQRSHV